MTDQTHERELCAENLRDLPTANSAAVAAAPNQPVHAVADREKGKTCARDGPGGPTNMAWPILARRVRAIPIAFASERRWRTHRQNEGQSGGGQQA